MTTPPPKLGIAIDLDQLRGLMQEFLVEKVREGQAAAYGPESLTDWKFETFLQWLSKRREPTNDNNILTFRIEKGSN